MRLIQQTPAWSLHAYIRFLGIEYTTENTFAFKALGLQLPLLVDNVQTKTELLAMSHLSKRYGNVPSEISPEVLFAAYLRQALVAPLLQLKQINRNVNKDIYRVMPLGLNFAFSAMEDIKDFICGDRNEPLPGATEAELLESITRVYSELNYSLLSKLATGTPPTFTQLPADDAMDEDTGFSATEESIDRLAYASPRGSVGSPGSSKTQSQRAHRHASLYVGVAEAVMFGHIAEVLCSHEKLAAILVQFEGLLAFFQFVCTNFFALPYDDAVKSGNDSCNWKSSLDAVLSNKFIDLECCERVKQCLLYGTPIPYVRLPKESSALNFALPSDPFAEENIYPNHDDVDNDSNPLASLHPSHSPTKSSPAKTAVLKNGSKDIFVVKDGPTALTKVGVDFSLSTDWRGAYYSVMGVFGVRRAPGDGDGASEVPLVLNTEPTVHRVPLMGAAFLLGVTAAFGGYAYYTTRKRR